MKVDLKKDDANIKAMRKVDYGKIWKDLLPTIQSREAQWTYRIGIWGSCQYDLFRNAVIQNRVLQSSFLSQQLFAFGNHLF